MPQSDGANEEKITKDIEAAEKELVKMSTELVKTHMLLKKEKLTDKRLKEAIKRANAALSKQVGLSKLRTDKNFEQLSEEVKEKVVWADDMMTELNELKDQLPFALKLMKKSPEGDFDVILKPTKRLAREVKQAPRHVGLMVKAIKKGIDTEGPYGELFNLVPAYLILFQIGNTVTMHVAKKP